MFSLCIMPFRKANSQTPEVLDCTSYIETKTRNVNTCKWTGITLYVKKSHIGQYISPLVIVGIRSRFNLAAISSPFSPEHHNKKD